MARARVSSYLDIAQTTPGLTAEEYEQRVKEADEESKKLKDWPKI